MAPASLRIQPARSPRHFLDAQRDFYRDDPHYAPPITLADAWQVDRRRNPYFQHAEGEFWLAERNGRVVGRISAARDRLHDEFHGDRIGFFGHFEAADVDVAAALLETAQAWLAEHGATAARGPIDLSTNYRCGLLVSGETGPPMVMMPYNPPQYAAWIEAAGFAKAKDVVAWMMRSATATTESFARMADRIRQRSQVVMRPLQMRRFAAEVDLLWDLYHRIWERNWGFVPMSAGEFHRTAKELKLVCKPELLVVLECAGTPAGFGLCVPDVNVGARACRGRLLPFGWWQFLRAMRGVHVARVLTLGVLPEYRKNGLDALLLYYYFQTAPPLGYPDVEASWVLEDNIEMLRGLQRLGGHEYRRYRIYQRDL